MKWIFGTLTEFPQTEYERIRKTLSPSRAARISGLKHPADQHRSLTADLLTEKLLLREFGIADARIEMTPQGQPILPGTGLFLSIAHSHKAVVCAVSQDPVGVDIEQIRPMDLAITRHICTREELRYLFGHDPSPEELQLCEDPALLRRFFEIWTGKEAYFKQKGTGITNLKGISILPLPRKIIQNDGYLITFL